MYQFRCQFRWVPTTAMLVYSPMKHLSEQTALENFMKDNVYSLREHPRLEEIRSKARADKKERANNKAKTSTTHLLPRINLKTVR